MKRITTILASLLLLLNGTGALYGGWNFITHPDGSSLHITLDWLKYSPFDNYLIPGIILLVVNGLFSFFTLAFLVFKLRGRTWLVMAQGVLLIGWIVVQMILIRDFNALHMVFGSIGIALTFIGWSMTGEVIGTQSDSPGGPDPNQDQ